MRIFVLDQFSEMGGAQHCLADLIPSLLALGWKVLAALPNMGPLFHVLQSQGVDVHLVPCGPYAFGHKTILDIARFAHDRYVASHILTRILNEARPDLIYVNGPRLLPAAARASGTTPIIFHSHSYLSKWYAASLIGRELKRKSVSVIGSSKYVADQWLRYAGRERVSVIYNGTPDMAIRSRTFPAGLEWRIGVIGRIAPEKGQLEFVRAAELLAASGLRARFLVHGAPLLSSPGYADVVRKAAKGLPVEFTGWHDSVESILGDLDLAIVPSPLHESTTRVILEAFSVGTPVVAFPSGGIPEVIEHGKTGFLAKARTADALAAEIQRTILLANELPEVAAAAREEWEERYTLAHYCDQVTDLMESVVARTTRRNNTAASSTNTAAPSNTGV